MATPNYQFSSFWQNAPQMYTAPRPQKPPRQQRSMDYADMLLNAWQGYLQNKQKAVEAERKTTEFGWKEKSWEDSQRYLKEGEKLLKEGNISQGLTLLQLGSDKSITASQYKQAKGPSYSQLPPALKGTYDLNMINNLLANEDIPDETKNFLTNLKNKMMAESKPEPSPEEKGKNKYLEMFAEYREYALQFGIPAAKKRFNVQDPQSAEDFEFAKLLRRFENLTKKHGEPKALELMGWEKPEDIAKRKTQTALEEYKAAVEAEKAGGPKGMADSVLEQLYPKNLEQQLRIKAQFEQEQQSGEVEALKTAYKEATGKEMSALWAILPPKDIYKLVIAEAKKALKEKPKAEWLAKINYLEDLIGVKFTADEQAQLIFPSVFGKTGEIKAMQGLGLQDKTINKVLGILEKNRKEEGENVIAKENIPAVMELIRVAFDQAKVIPGMTQPQMDNVLKALTIMLAQWRDDVRVPIEWKWKHFLPWGGQYRGDTFIQKVIPYGRRKEEEPTTLLEHFAANFPAQDLQVATQTPSINIQTHDSTQPPGTPQNPLPQAGTGFGGQPQPKIDPRREKMIEKGGEAIGTIVAALTDDVGGKPVLKKDYFLRQGLNHHDLQYFSWEQIQEILKAVGVPPTELVQLREVMQTTHPDMFLNQNPIIPFKR